MASSRSGCTADGQACQTQRYDVLPHSSVCSFSPSLTYVLLMFVLYRQEAYGAPDVNPDNGYPLDIGLHSLENPGAAKTNSGMFANGLLKATESDHTGSRGIPEVKVVGNGHCHSRCLFRFRSRSVCAKSDCTSHRGLQAREECVAVFRRWRVRPLLSPSLSTICP